jgi:predicted glycosyltransferase
MRVWVDITDASHVVFFAPIVRRLEGAGHTVTVTARRFAGADLVLRRHGLGGVLTTGHRGGGLGTRAVGLVNRTAQLIGSASSGRFDVAAGSHASDFVLAAWALGIPQLTFLDDERLRRSNSVNVRLVDEVAVPEAIPQATLADLGASLDKLFRYPGFKEEYYLYDVRPDPDVLAHLGVDRRHMVGVLRPPRPPRVRVERAALPSGEAARSEAALLDLAGELAGRRNVALVLVARDAEQRARFLARVPRGLTAPDGPLPEAVSLLAAADFVLGAGGVMAREAAALGTPAYTVSQRPPSAVDAALLADRRLRPAATDDEIVLRKKDDRLAAVQPRDPSIFVERLIDLAQPRSRRARLGRLVSDVGDGDAPPLV